MSGEVDGTRVGSGIQHPTANLQPPTSNWGSGRAGRLRRLGVLARGSSPLPLARRQPIPGRDRVALRDALRRNPDRNRDRPFRAEARAARCTTGRSGGADKSVCPTGGLSPEGEGVRSGNARNGASPVPSAGRLQGLPDTGGRLFERGCSNLDWRQAARVDAMAATGLSRRSVCAKADGRGRGHEGAGPAATTRRGYRRGNGSADVASTTNIQQPTSNDQHPTTDGEEGWNLKEARLRGSPGSGLDVGGWMLAVGC